MTAFVAMLRAVNVGGTGKLAMSELRAIGESCGFARSRTFIASGNLLFDSESSEADVAATLGERIERQLGKPVPLFVRTGAEMAGVAVDNPFAHEAPNRVVAHFIDEVPDQAILDAATGRKDEQLALGRREIYIFYGDGMADSKLKLPVFRHGTARNMNSVAKMAALLA